MTAERDDWTLDGSFFSGDGAAVRVHDDVFLIDAAPVQSQGSGGPWQSAPAGSKATVLFFTTASPIEVDLECDVEDGFCFVQTPATNLRLAMRHEEKWPKDDRP